MKHNDGGILVRWVDDHRELCHILVGFSREKHHDRLFAHDFIEVVHWNRNHEVQEGPHLALCRLLSLMYSRLCNLIGSDPFLVSQQPPLFPSMVEDLSARYCRRKIVGGLCLVDCSGLLMHGVSAGVTHLPEFASRVVGTGLRHRLFDLLLDLARNVKLWVVLGLHARGRARPCLRVHIDICLLFQWWPVVCLVLRADEIIFLLHRDVLILVVLQRILILPKVVVFDVNRISDLAAVP